MIYLDSSVLVSLHIRDVNTPAALRLVRGMGAALLISSWVEFEAINAFSLRVFRNEMLPIHRDNAVRDLENDVQNRLLTVLPLPESAFARAKVLAGVHTSLIGVRATDLLHVSAALELGASALYTFDQKQHQTAQAAGLAVNPLP